MPPTHKIALVQLAPTPLDPSSNFARAASFIQKAAGEGCALAVLPEYHLTGWYPKDPGFQAKCTAAIRDEYLGKYKALAKELKISIVPGTIMSDMEGEGDVKEGEKADGGFGNVAYFIDENGEVVGEYVKKNLWYVEFQVNQWDQATCIVSKLNFTKWNVS
jgi:predicted amidohydrolase